MWKKIVNLGLKAAAVTICAVGAYKVYVHFRREIIDIPDYRERQELETKRDNVCQRRGEADKYIFASISDEETNEDDQLVETNNRNQNGNDIPSSSKRNPSDEESINHELEKPPATNAEILTSKILDEIIKNRSWDDESNENSSPNYLERQELETNRENACQRRGEVDTLASISDEETNEDVQPVEINNRNQNGNDIPSSSKENPSNEESTNQEVEKPPTTDAEILTSKILDEIIKNRSWNDENDESDENSNDLPRSLGT
ncbi:putative uncharacterized protein DDB_G0289963 [Cimex lectularius]|uniref:Uncharacterized protein n=1 Tax=Cimex lectularius TaxID=79782 RepID=A0A8I6SBR3_CIMLE|nr:putative uncharacterized protein DDB_G0289963 [Cimex lectularius]XP_014261441.1 putative uncharacterized protein DDB_G0289963 [Cimex lectularius]